MAYRGSKTPYERYLSALRPGDRVELGDVAFGSFRFVGYVEAVSPLKIRLRDPHFPKELSRVQRAPDGYLDPWKIKGPSWLYEPGADERLRRMSKRPREKK